MSARRRHRRARRRRSSRTRTTSSSRTTPTPTWSATPGVWDATVGALERRSTRCLGRVVGGDRGRRRATTRPARRAARDHRRPRQRRRSCATPTGSPVTAHSLNPVPFVLVGRAAAGRRARATASSPTSRRRCSSSRACRRWDGMTGRSRDPVIASVAVPHGGQPTRESAPGHSARSSSASRSSSPILLQARGYGPVRHVRRRLGRLPQPPRRRAPPLAVHDRRCSSCSSLFSLASFIFAPSPTA